MEELLATREIAGYLKLRPETVLRKIKRGDIPAIKVGGRFRFDKRQIDDTIPVVIITGYPEDGLMEQAIELGPLGVMKKPFSTPGIRKFADNFLVK